MLHLHCKPIFYRTVPLIVGLLLSPCSLYSYISSSNRFDPFPVWGPLDRQDFLLDRQKLKYEGTSWWNAVGNHCKVSVSGFFQNADSGKPMDGGDLPQISVIDTSASNSIGFQYVPIIDIMGRTPMIPLVMGSSVLDPADPTKETVIMLPTPPPGYGTLLTNAAEGLFEGATASPSLPNLMATPPIPNYEEVIDTGTDHGLGAFGFFSFPSKYRKRGARFDLLVNLFDCVGLHVRGGFASICHVPKPPIDKTCEPLECPFTIPIQGFPMVTAPNVETLLMNQLDCILKEIGMGYSTYLRTGLEQISTELYWRYPFALNQDREGWLQILAIPYFEGGFAYSPADARDTNELYNVPLGNDKHLAAGFCAGVCLDFASTVELGGEIGYTHFFDKDFDCYRIPNSKLQNNIYPFRTSVNVAPGRNLYFSAKLTARNFLERLSGCFEFVALEHAADCIRLCDTTEKTSAFVPDVLARKTGFKVKVANLSLTYPLTPNFNVGFMWQAPLSQRGAVRTTTIMFGLIGSF